MEIPDWVRWIALGLVVLNLLGLVPVVRRMRGGDPVERTAARIDLFDSAGSLLMLSGIGLRLVPLAAAGLAIMGVAITVGLVRRIRARSAA
ncbi:hypothetical protein [Streptomyces sp. NPDC051909]|uniref:hypothetical protein n=1 Tax=Streptomyces sp. NPDC051909 TaxID=3154944 RepID=UPI003443BA6A